MLKSMKPAVYVVAVAFLLEAERKNQLRKLHFAVPVPKTKIYETLEEERLCTGEAWVR